MITEFDKYYQYTFDEVIYKIFGNKTKGNRNIDVGDVKDDNLLYLIKLYVKYKSKWEDIELIQFILRYDNPYLSIAFRYNIFDSWWDDVLIIENKKEFIEFINNPDLFKDMKKFNL